LPSSTLAIGISFVSVPKNCAMRVSLRQSLSEKEIGGAATETRCPPETLQDTLGDLNDIIDHQKLARLKMATLVPDRKRSHKKAFAVGRLSGQEEARFASVMKQAERAHRIFAHTPPFWR
jgi:hypothetical protein